MSSNLNRCKFTSADSGTGTSITVLARYSNSFFTPAEAGAVDGKPYTYVIQQGNDIEIQQDQIYTSSTTSFARGTPALSMISGVVGTSKIVLDTTQVIGIGASARDLVAPLLAEVRTVTASTDALLDSDGFGQVTYNRSSAIAVSLAQAGALTFRKGWACFVRNTNSGVVTITPTTSTINGAATLVLNDGDSAIIVSDGTNYTAIVETGTTLRSVRAVSTNSDALVNGDGFGFVSYTYNGAVAVSLAQAGTSRQFLKGWFAVIKNGTGTVTVTPTTSTINGASNVVLAAGEAAIILSDGTNYTAVVIKEPTNWSVSFTTAQSLSASQKAVAIKNVAPSVLAKSSNYTAVADDRNAPIVLTSSATLLLTGAATLGNGWRCPVRNAGTGVWVIDPNSSETINGATTIRIYPGEAFDICCDGSAFFTIGRSTGKVLLNSQTASSSASIVFGASLITDEFKLYTVEFDNVVPTTSSSGLYLTISQDDGSTYKSASYAWQRHGTYTSSPGSGSYAGNGSDSKIKIVDDLLDTAAAYGATGTLQFWSPAVVGIYHMFRSFSTFNTSISSLGLCQWRIDGTYLGDGFAINNIKFAMSSGNIAQGRFSLYGHRG